MSVPARHSDKDGDAPSEPPRLPQRWALILLAGGVVTFVGTVTFGPVVGIPAGTATIVALHKIVD
jgi:hypothetical protein